MERGQIIVDELWFYARANSLVPDLWREAFQPLGEGTQQDCVCHSGVAEFQGLRLAVYVVEAWEDIVEAVVKVGGIFRLARRDSDWNQALPRDGCETALAQPVRISECLRCYH